MTKCIFIGGNILLCVKTTLYNSPETQPASVFFFLRWQIPIKSLAGIQISSVSKRTMPALGEEVWVIMCSNYPTGLTLTFLQVLH